MSLGATAPSPDRRLSREADVALRPGRAYRELLSDAAEPAGLHVLARPAVVLLVIGTFVPIMAVQRVTLGLVATAAVSWSFVVIVQAIVGLLVVFSAPRRAVDCVRALDLWFAGHLPYSLWLLTSAVVFASVPSTSIEMFILAALIPAAWTTVIVASFCRTVLNTTPAGALWRAAVHQGIVWGIGLSYVAWAAGGWFRLVE